MKMSLEAPDLLRANPDAKLYIDENIQGKIIGFSIFNA